MSFLSWFGLNNLKNGILYTILLVNFRLVQCCMLWLLTILVTGDIYLQGPGQTTMGIYIRAVVKGGAADKVCVILDLVLLSIYRSY